LYRILAERLRSTQRCTNDLLVCYTVLLCTCYGFHRISCLTLTLYANQVDNEASLNTLVSIAVNVVVLLIFTSQTIIYGRPME